MKKFSHGKSLKNKLTELKNALLGLLFPKNGTCPSCGRVLFHEKYICLSCGDKRKRPVYFCPQCGRTVEKDGVCVACKTFTVKWDKAVCLYTYEEPVPSVIWHMKYRNRPFIAEDLGTELGECIRVNCNDGKFDVITFIPSGEERMKERGYNQAQLLAQSAGQALGIPVKELLTAKDSAHQVGLTAAERFENSVDRFSVKDGEDISDKRIIVIDDVLTTGSTMAAASVQLKNAGAEYILAATVAQTVSFVDENE